MRHNVVEYLQSDCFSRVPKRTRVREQKIARSCAIQFQIGSHSKRVTRVEKDHRRVILPDSVFKKIIHADAYNHYIWLCSLPKQASQPVVPIVVAGGLEENGIDAHVRRSQSTQPFHFDSMQKQGITYH